MPNRQDIHPATLRATAISAARGTVVIFSYVPRVEVPVLPWALTAAETAVVQCVLKGMSNADIARQRGRAVRTVANQLAAIFKKLGVNGRTELAAQLAHLPI